MDLTKNIKNSNDSFRKLASVQEIIDVKPHTNADRLSLAIIQGWQVIIGLDEFKTGDKVIYFEIDSLLPAKKWSLNFEKYHYKIKSQKIRKEISQGLIVSLKVLEDEENLNNETEESSNLRNLKDINSLPIGFDLTNILGIEKYNNDSEEDDKTTSLNGVFPTHFGINKSDEPRIQSEVRLLNEFKGLPYYASLKYDGTSATYILNKKEIEKDIDTNINNTNSNPETQFIDDFYVCSRNQRREYLTDDKIGCCYSKAAQKYRIQEKLKSVNYQYAIQCEIYGPNIQKNRLGVKELSLVVYTIFDIFNKKYLDMEEMIEVCKKLDLPMVKIVQKGDNFNYTVDELKSLVKGCYEGTKNQREGFVFRKQNDWYDSNLSKRYSFKMINDEFLLELEKPIKEKKEKKENNEKKEKNEKNEK